MNHEFAQDNTPCMLGRERFREHSRPQCAVVGADLLLLAVGLLHKRVNEHTHHGDGRAGDTDRRHGRAKSNGSGDLGGGRGGGILISQCPSAFKIYVNTQKVRLRIQTRMTTRFTVLPTA